MPIELIDGIADYNQTATIRSNCEQYMPNIGALLKAEITRLSRREIRHELQSMRKASAEYRSAIASLKRRAAKLEREMARLAKQGTRVTGEPVPVSRQGNVRFQARGVRSLRKRLGLSAAQLAKLLNVSEQSVYNWEAGKTTPRKEQLASIVRLRSIGKREAHASLTSNAAEGKSTKQAKGRARTRS